MADDQQDEDEFVTTAGPIRIDWPRAVGYYVAVGAAVAFEVTAPPLGVFIAVMPLVKLLKRKHATWPERLVAAVVEGAGKPVGGDAEGVVRPTWVDEKNERESDSVPSLSGQIAPAPMPGVNPAQAGRADVAGEQDALGM